MYLTRLGGGVFGNSDEWIKQGARFWCDMCDRVPVRDQCCAIARAARPSSLTLRSHQRRHFQVPGLAHRRHDGELQTLELDRLRFGSNCYNGRNVKIECMKQFELAMTRGSNSSGVVETGTWSLFI